MSLATPLTASSVIQRSLPVNIEDICKEKPLLPDLGKFESDIVTISHLGIEKQQKEAQIEASRKIEEIANDVIKISSTIGKARSVGSLTNSQASSLYNKIALLL